MRNAGFLTGNESRAIFGMPRSVDPNMDRVFANAALVPLGTPAERITITEGAPADPNQQQEAQNVIEAGQQAAADAAQQALPPGKPTAALPPGKQYTARQWARTYGRAAHDGATSKTWETDPSCTSHKHLDGETVSLGADFTSGDPLPGGGDCTCGISFGQE
jgi:hypothetical protein